MTDKNTVDAIIAGAIASRSQLALLDHTLQGAIDKIVLDAAKQGRALTNDEKNQRKLLWGQQADVQEAFAELAFATAARLDNADDVKQFREELRSINANLREDRDLRCNSGAGRGRTREIGGASRRRSGKGLVGMEQCNRHSSRGVSNDSDVAKHKHLDSKPLKRKT